MIIIKQVALISMLWVNLYNIAAVMTLRDKHELMGFPNTRPVGQNFSKFQLNLELTLCHKVIKHSTLQCYQAYIIQISQTCIHLIDFLGTQLFTREILAIKINNCHIYSQYSHSTHHTSHITQHTVHITQHTTDMLKFC